MSCHSLQSKRYSRDMTKPMKQSAMKTLRYLAFVSTIAAGASGLLFSRAQTPAKGTLQRIKVHGESLVGNLEGDSPDRNVLYLSASWLRNRSETPLSGNLFAARISSHGPILDRRQPQA